MASAFERLGTGLRSALQIRPGEGRKTALLFLHLLTASSIFILGRTVRDTLFLSRFDVAYLPWMFVCYGIASALTVVLYSRVADALRRSRIIVLSCALGAATYFATWLAVRAELTWIYPVFYVWSEVAANLFIVQFWTLANDVNDPRAARRLFPTVGAARVLGVVVIGLATSLIVAAIGTAQLLLVLIGLMGLVVLLALALRRDEPTAAPAKPKRQREKKAPKITRDPHVRSLSLFLLFTFVALTLGDYQFKVIARATFREDDLARYFSLFYAGTGIVSFLFQIFVTPRLLRRLGVGWGMAVMPGVFGAASAALLFVPHLAVATVMKFADNGFQYTVHETTLQALYVPFPERIKARTRAFLDAVVKPLSYGVGGLALVFLAPLLEVHVLSAVVLGIVVLWLGTIPWARRRYIAALRRTLARSGSLTLESMAPLDAEAHAVLSGLLERGDPRISATALAHLEGPIPRELIAHVEHLALHPEPEVRAAALGALARTPDIDPEPILEGAQSGDDAVRTAATEALGPVLGDACVEPASALLDDASQDVRVGALEVLLQHGGIEGSILGGQRLALLLAGDRAAKVEAARVLRRLGRAAYRPVRDLLSDPDSRVRRAGLRAATKIGDPRLVPVLMEHLAVRRTRNRASAALIAVGEPAVPALIDAFDAPETSRSVRLLVPRMLRRIPCRASYDALHERARTIDGHVRLRVLSGIASLRAKLELPPLELSEVQELLRWELGRAHRHLAAWEGTKDLDSPLMDEAMHFRFRRFDKRVLRLLSLRYDKGALDLVRKGLAHADRRANALELLDGLVEPSLRTLVMPWFDDAPVAERVDLELAGDVPEAEAYLVEQSDNPNPFIASLALDALRRNAPDAAAERCRACATHDAPLVREGALAGAFALDEALGRDIAQSLRDDPHPAIARRASLLLETTEPTMHTTLEKVLLLKSADVFSRVAAEDLAPMALAAEERRVDAGETVLVEGDLGDSLFVIVSGSVTVSRAGKVLAELGPGEAFGEMAVLDAEPRSATVKANEETELLCVESEDFYDVLYEQMEIAEGVIRMLTSRLREADRAVDPVSMVPPPNDH